MRMRTLAARELLQVLRDVRSHSKRLELTSSLFANISQELRDPMNGNLGGLDLAFDTTLNTEQTLILPIHLFTRKC